MNKITPEFIYRIDSHFIEVKRANFIFFNLLFSFNLFYKPIKAFRSGNGPVFHRRWRNAKS